MIVKGPKLMLQIMLTPLGKSCQPFFPLGKTHRSNSRVVGMLDFFLPDPGDQGLEEALSVHWCGFVPQPKLQLQSAPNSVGMCSVLTERNASGFYPQYVHRWRYSNRFKKEKHCYTLKPHRVGAWIEEDSLEILQQFINRWRLR